jgi:hypothetical protein
MMSTNNQAPSRKDVLRMLQRMHNEAAASESQHGAHASSAQHEQLAAKYRNAANKN